MKRTFTLIELLVVIAIIAICHAAALCSVVYPSTTSFRRQAC